MPGAYKCPKCQKRMKFVSSGMLMRDGKDVGATKWRCPRCDTEMTITEA